MRHDRRESDADERRAPPRRRDRVEEARRPGARAGRRRRLQHGEVSTLAARHQSLACRACSRSRRTTTSRRRKASSSTTAPSPTARRCRSSSTTCRAAPAATSSRGRSCACSPHPEHRRRQGSLRQHDADVRGLPRRAGRLLVLSGDDALTLPLMAVGGRGIISVASNVVPGADVADGRSRASAAISPPHARAHRACMPLMHVNFIESNPIPVKAAMAVMGLLRGGLPAADGAAVGEQSAQDCGCARRDGARGDAD